MPSSFLAKLSTETICNFYKHIQLMCLLGRAKTKHQIGITTLNLYVFKDNQCITDFLFQLGELLPITSVFR